MKKQQWLALLLALVMLMSFAACKKTAEPAAASQTEGTKIETTDAPKAAEATAEPAAEPTEEPAPEEPATEPTSEKTLTLVVTFGNVTETLTVVTDADTLGAALVEKGLASGSDSEYGLFVDTVNGHFADAALGRYWVFTKSGEMVMTGVDTTPIADGEQYEWSIYGEEPQGAKTVNLTVTFEGVTELLAVRTDADTLGAALAAEGLISGSDSEYGLFVDTVNGHFADAAKGMYWVFTKGGEMVMTGVDTTPIEDGDGFEWYIYE